MTSTPEPAPIREDVVELLLNCDPAASAAAGRLVSINGSYFTASEVVKYESATIQEKQTVAERIFGNHDWWDDIIACERRLLKLAWAAPDHAQDRFLEALDQRGYKTAPARAGQAPPATIWRENISRITVAAAAFRELILPDIAGPARAEAQALLERVETATGTA